MRILLRSIAAGSLALAISFGCSPKEPVPAGPDHPADPAAAEAPEPPAATAPTDEPSTDTGHDHAGHGDHGGDDSDATEAPAAPTGPEALVAAEMAAYQAAKPVFDEHCASCHTSTKKPSKARKKALKHFVMDSYPFGGHHAGELGATVRKVLGVGGGKATMPKDDPGAVQGPELDLIVAWSTAYDAAAQAGAGHHGEADGDDHGHHHGHGD